MRIQFNTKRLYTAEGQIIIAEQCVATYEVHFNDVSRMISGKYKAEVLFPRADVLKDSVMHHYDNGDYTGTLLSDAPKFDPKEELIGGLIGTSYE